MMMGLPDRDIRAGSLLNCDALWLEIYNSLTSASLIGFPLRKVSLQYQCVCVCVRLWNSMVYTAVPAIWSLGWNWFLCISLCFVLFPSSSEPCKSFSLLTPSAVWQKFNVKHLDIVLALLYIYILINDTYVRSNGNAHSANTPAAESLHFCVSSNIYPFRREDQTAKPTCLQHTTWMQSTMLYSLVERRNPVCPYPANWYYRIVFANSVPYGKQARARFKNTHTHITKWLFLLLDVLGKRRSMSYGGVNTLQRVVTQPAGGLGSRRIPPVLTHISSWRFWNGRKWSVQML